MMTTEQIQPADAGRIDRGVRAHHPERAAFERWWCKAYHPAALEQMEAGCYLDQRAGVAWDAWMAARPPRHQVGALVNLAAKCLSPDPLRALWRLEEESGRTLGRRALSSAVAEADENLRQMAIALRGVADAL